jgi:hypothetical protein
LPIVAAVAAGVVGAAVRYGVIEYKAVHNLCVGGTGAWPCEVRSLIIVTLMNTPALGLLALSLGLVSLLGNQRALIVPALVTGALGLFLYNTELGACGLLLGALHAVREAGGGPSSPPSPARRRENTS